MSTEPSPRAANRLLFIESKGPGDEITKHEHWLSAAAAAGLSDRNLGIVRWLFGHLWK